MAAKNFLVEREMGMELKIELSQNRNPVPQSDVAGGDLLCGGAEDLPREDGRGVRGE